MLIRTPADLGAAVRDRRKQLDLDQATLAKRVGASRQWVIGIEGGRARAELGLVLRTLNVLDIPLSLGAPIESATRVLIPSVDIDAILSSARKNRS